MKRKLLKKLVCVFGILFITFPAWSAVPSNLLPADGSWNQAPAIADVENPLFEGDMILAGSGGGGIFNDFGSTLTVINSILYEDTPEEILGDAVVSYSNVQGFVEGADDEANIDLDPLYIDLINGDLHLMAGSPCIDAANSTPLLDADVSQDLDGWMRFVDVVEVTNTGVGLFNFVDMGAYEFHCSALPGDINWDGKVDFIDMSILAANWLQGV